MVLIQNAKLEKVSSRSILFMCFHEPRVAGRLADVPQQHLPGPEAENIKCGPLQMLLKSGSLMMRPVLGKLAKQRPLLQGCGGK